MVGEYLYKIYKSLVIQNKTEIMGLNLKQIPIKSSTDEIFDIEWSKDKKKSVRKAYREFFRTLPRKTRSTLGKMINDDQYNQ